jgi:hypothetical protein
MARNVRVNQQVLAAATPALDRAKAKIEYLLGPGKPTLDTPSDETLYQAMSSYNNTNPDAYTFGDEKRLVLKADLSLPPDNTARNDDPKGSILTQGGEEKETLNTAWTYPVDTNSDGKFDTFSLYGIFFRTPTITTTTRPRRPLDARTPPMQTGKSDPACTQGQGTVADLVGNSGWERREGRFQKSFFVYTVNVPITEAEASTLGPQYKAFAGTPSISALEYQQDQSLIPLSNNAVVYEDDLDISPGPPLNLNGRIVTNSNLLVSGLGGARNIRLFQVSSKDSCFYSAENSKIVVAGNVVNGWSGASTPTNAVEVHLFKNTADPQPDVNAPAIDTTNQSVAENSLQVLYNNQAYSQRLNALVGGQMEADPGGTNDPFSVRQAQQPPKSQTRVQALEDYFKQRLRKIPFAEVLPGTPNGGIDPAIPKTSYIQGSGDSLRPIDAWSLPTNGTPVVGTVGGPTNLTIRPNQLESRNIITENIPSGESEENLGERVIVGNNLPSQRWDGTKFVDEKQFVDGVTDWTVPDDERRSRKPQVITIGDVGATDRGNGTGEVPDSATAPNPPYRDGFWERTAAEISKSPLDNVGGLRVITSAGVYDRTNSFLPPPRWIDANGILKSGPPSAVIAGNPAINTYDDPATVRVEQYPVVWPDSMPMSPLGLGSKVYDNTNPTVGAVEAVNWKRWVQALIVGGGPQVVVAQANNSDLPATQTNPLFPFVVETPTTARQFAKGDLRMRATAVYHYAHDGYDPVALAAGAQPQQKPLACVSSYYDPTNAFTARNLIGLGGAPTDVSGEGALAQNTIIPVADRPGSRQEIIGSNNGITYGPPTQRANPSKSTDNGAGLLSGGDAILEAQANLVFPDGRFANGPLRTALQVEPAARTLAQKSAIDSTNCALQILDGTISPQPALIPHGAIQEVAFLNGREIKAVDSDDPNTIVNEAFTLSSPLGTAPPAAQLPAFYNQPLEEREPLEIRATQIDLLLLRGHPAPSTAIGPEWLLPNSGIIYASRDDALPDRSNRFDPTIPGAANASKRASPSDYQLDPTRKPNGIVLIRGQQLFRGGGTPTPPSDLNALVREKGLTLVSNLPVYIKGDFNPHGNIPASAPVGGFTEVEEFTQLVNGTWANFYGRTKNELDPNFACRAKDPRLPNCTSGDFWRPANVLADAVTLLSRNYRFGFRNEGDFDLRNNAGAAAVFPRRQQGFFNNNFVTNGLSSGAFLTKGNLAITTDPPNARLTDSTYTADFTQGLFTSSYFNNYVTPVQRRGPFPEYLMETCTKLPVSECTDNDWFVDPLTDPPRTASAAVGSSLTGPYDQPNPDTSIRSFQAGSTVDPPLPELQRFPRRVAFQRGTADQKLSNATTTPRPWGINNGTIAVGPGTPRTGSTNALWLAADNGGSVAYDATNPPYRLNTNNNPPGTTDGSRVRLPTIEESTVPLLMPIALSATYSYSGSQPLLMPVPQIFNEGPAVPGTLLGPGNVAMKGWMPRALPTTFNLIMAVGDTPSRSLDTANGDFNGGLQNLPRFLETWSSTGGFTIPTNIRGSFIQQNRSAFSTAPYLPILPPTFSATLPAPLASLFALSANPPAPLPPTTYNIQGARIPYFTPPTRNWGYDVGLLSQPPDLFTQKFTTPSTETRPAEYFREVARNDKWVETLMCGVVAPDQPSGGQNATAIRSNCLR